MKKSEREALVSAVYDDEVSPDELSTEQTKGLDSYVAWFRRLSSAMRVPADFAEEDPNFIARFRARRDAVSEALAPGRGWRWLALRLVPLAAVAILATGLVLRSPAERPDAFTELELREIGDGLPDLAKDDLAEEPVLRIAFGDL